MSRKNISIAIMVFFSLNVCALVLAQEQQSTDILERARAKRTKELSNSLRGNQIFTFHSGFVFIGDLLYWKSILPLADNQAVALKELDSLLYSAKSASIGNDADYLDTNPRDYKEYLDRNKRRRKAAVKHGQLMSFTGLLTKSQSNAVVQHYLSEQQANAFHHEFTQDLMHFTKTQRDRLARVQSEYNQNTKPLFLGSMLPGSPDVTEEIRRFKKEFDSASMKVLTPTQKTKWTQLTTKQTLSKSAPVMPLPSNTEQGFSDVKELSDVFRAIVHVQNQNELNLSKAQNQLLDKLYLLTQRGLFWIEAADSSQDNGVKNRSCVFIHTKAEFLKHAEQVALQGILTEHQVKQVQDVM